VFIVCERRTSAINTFTRQYDVDKPNVRFSMFLRGITCGPLALRGKEKRRERERERERERDTSTFFHLYIRSVTMHRRRHFYPQPFAEIGFERYIDQTLIKGLAYKLETSTGKKTVRAFTQDANLARRSTCSRIYSIFVRFSHPSQKSRSIAGEEEGRKERNRNERGIRTERARWPRNDQRCWRRIGVAS